MRSKRGSDEPVADHFFSEMRGASLHHKMMSLERVASRYVGYLTLLAALTLLFYAAVRIF